MIECLTAIKINWMMVVLVVGVTSTVWVLWKVQRSPKQIDFVDLMLDVDGKASWTKMTAIGAFLVASWGFAMLIGHDKMTEWLFGLYIAVYSGVPVAYRFIASKAPPEIPQQTVTVKAPADQTVEVKAST